MGKGVAALKAFSPATLPGVRVKLQPKRTGDVRVRIAIDERPPVPSVAPVAPLLAGEAGSPGKRSVSLAAPRPPYAAADASPPRDGARATPARASYPATTSSASDAHRSTRTLPEMMVGSPSVPGSSERRVPRSHSAHHLRLPSRARAASLPTMFLLSQLT